MAAPVDITDPRIAKAFAHPLRIEILGLLENRVASPVQLAAELGSGLSQTSYHVRQLRHLGLIKLVKRRMQRGAVEHYYTATVRPTIPDSAWNETPSVVKRALVGGKVGQIGTEVSAAARRGGFDREGVYVTRTRLRLSHEGWQRVNQELTNTLARIDAIAARDQESEGTGANIDATAVLLFFESPPPESFDTDEHDLAAPQDEFEDLVSDRATD